MVVSAGEHAPNFPFCSTEAGTYDFNQPDQPRKPKPPSGIKLITTLINHPPSSMLIKILKIISPNISEENFILLDLVKKIKVQDLPTQD